MTPSNRALAAEFIGTAALVCVVVGSGIMGERLAAGNAALALLANSLATGFGLYVLITVLAPVSGAHFNPAVTLLALLRRGMKLGTSAAYWAAQVTGGVAGTFLAHAMFELPLLQASSHARGGIAQGLSEVVATAGLLLTILGFSKTEPRASAAGVGLYIAAAYWFTASTSFANPAVTVARAFTDTFSGIQPANVPLFVAAQALGALAAWLLYKLLFVSGAEPAARDFDGEARKRL